MADVVQLAREVKMIRSGLPIDELVRRSRLIDKLEGQLNGYKSEIKQFKRTTAETSKEVKKATKQLNAYQKEFNKVKQQISKDAKKFADEIKKNTQGIRDTYDKLNKPLERITKGLDKYVGAASLGFGIAGVAISFMALKASERNQAAFDKQVNRFQVDMSKQLGILYTFKSRFDKFQKEVDRRFQVLNREADLASNAIKMARTYADRAYKLANDGLYESRVRISRLNDVAAQARSNASKALLQQTALQNQLTQAQVQAKNAAIEASKARVGVQLVDSKATTAQLQAKTAQSEATQARVGVKLADSKATTAQIEAKQANAKAVSLQPQVTQAITTANQAVAIARNIKVPPPVTTVVNQGDTTTAPQKKMSQSEFNQYLRQNGIILKVDAAQTTAQTALEVASKGAAEPIGNKALGIGSTALSLGANNQSQLNRLDAEFKQFKANPPSLLDPRVPELQQKIRERETVDNQALQKLNEIQAGNALLVPAVIAGLTPAMQAAIGRGNQNLLEQLPDKTATAVQNAPCSGRGCGGRTAARVDGLADELGALRNQVNSLPNTVGNVVNAGANAAQIPLLNTINNKLGAQLPNGGISGKLNRLGSWLGIDRAMNTLTLFVTIHNAAFLSGQLGTTLLEVVSQGLAVFQIKDLDGNAIDLNSAIGQGFEAFLKSVVGQENYAKLSVTWAKASRVYQAAANVLSTLSSIQQATLSAVEIVSSQSSKIGNALRAYGAVGEKAYEWMNPNPNFDNRFFVALEKADDAANMVLSVTSDVLTAQEQLLQLEKDKEEFKAAQKGLREDGTVVKPGFEKPEFEPKKALEDARKAFVKTANIDPNALKESSDGNS